jgi:hypothetical protein
MEIDHGLFRDLYGGIELRMIGNGLEIFFYSVNKRAGDLANCADGIADKQAVVHLPANEQYNLINPMTEVVIN